MNPGQELAADTFLRMLAAGAATGGAFRLGMGALRGAMPRYDPPEVSKPIVVDVPRYVDTPVAKPIPLPAKNKPLPAAKAEPKPEPKKETKAANDPSLFEQAKDWFVRQLPTFTPPEGLPGKTNPTAADVPLVGATAPLGFLAGGLGGYHLASKLHDAARRRMAQKDLEDAQREYQDAVLTRNAPVKAALDRAYEAFVKVAAEPSPSGHSEAYRAVASALFPGLALNETIPGAGAVNLGAASLLGGLGGYLGYNKFRDKDRAAALRKSVERVDRENASQNPAPIVARIVPVSR